MTRVENLNYRTASELLDSPEANTSLGYEVLADLLKTALSEASPATRFTLTNRLRETLNVEAFQFVNSVVSSLKITELTNENFPHNIERHGAIKFEVTMPQIVTKAEVLNHLLNCTSLSFSLLGNKFTEQLAPRHIEVIFFPDLEESLSNSIGPSMKEKASQAKILEELGLVYAPIYETSVICAVVARKALDLGARVSGSSAVRRHLNSFKVDISDPEKKLLDVLIASRVKTSDERVLSIKGELNSLGTYYICGSVGEVMAVPRPV